MLTVLGHARSIVLMDGQATAVDVYGDDVSVWPETVVAGCAWWPSATTEAEPVGSDTTVTRYCLLMPESTVHAASGLPPSRLDRVALAGVPGVWRIDGDPRQHFSPITGATGGLFAFLEKVTG